MRRVSRLDDCFRSSTSAKISFVGTISHRLWLEDVLWASDCFNRSATEANTR